MIERSWMRFLDSLSGNLKSKIQNRKWLGIVAIGVTFAMCGVVAQAQQPKKVPRIGYLSAQELAFESARSEPIRPALRELGYIEGQNIAIEYRYAEGKIDRRSELAAELVRLKVDIIVVSGGGNWVQAGKNATKTIPIVMVGPGADPVKAGIVESLARPGGNVTGLRPFPQNLGTAQAIDRTVTWTSPESSKNSTTSRSTTSIVEWKNTSNGCGSIRNSN